MRIDFECHKFWQHDFLDHTNSQQYYYYNAFDRDKRFMFMNISLRLSEVYKSVTILLLNY